MRPLAILTGFLLGTSASITFSMAVVGLIFVILGPDYPQIQSETKPLLQAAGLFTCLTAVSGLSFIALIKHKPWAWLPQVAMWGLAATIVRYFWP